ncbi:MAG: hypothetical protein KU38_00245 [Sulfurovum sp. FS08-3]|nr:MAG: hypothetical protein KU38_00245 [Sulfurovum sp. FS08-3]
MKKNIESLFHDTQLDLTWKFDLYDFGCTKKEALEYIQQLNAENYCGYNDWRLPTALEINNLYYRDDTIIDFDNKKKYWTSTYISSSCCDGYDCACYFSYDRGLNSEFASMNYYIHLTRYNNEYTQTDDWKEVLISWANTHKLLTYDLESNCKRDSYGESFSPNGAFPRHKIFFHKINSIYANKRKIQILPREISYLKNLTSLTLSSNLLSNLPLELYTLEHLQYLNLSNNHFSSLSKLLGSLISLVELDLSENSLEEIPKEIRNLNKLKKINLSKNKLTSIPKEIGKLNSLIELDIGSNQLTKLPVEIINLKNLKKLSLIDNKRLSLTQVQIEWLKDLYCNECKISIDDDWIEILYKWINKYSEKSIYSKQDLLNLTEISVYHNEQISTLPSELFYLDKLEKFTFFETNLSDLPNEIGKLVKLEKLNLYSANLTKLPIEITELFHLKELNLAYNKITELPKDIGNLNNLVELNLEANYLKELPSSIIYLKNLKKLSLEKNKDLILSQEQELWLKELKNNKCKIVSIDESWIDNLLKWADKNRIYDNVLPRNKTSILNLTEFQLWEDNQIKVLPREIGKLENLISIDLFWTYQLEQIPKEIGNLNNLRKIHLGENKLKELPKEIGYLSNLEELDISTNSIFSLPQEIVYLTNLKKLSLISFVQDIYLSLEQIEWIRELKRNGCRVDIPDSVINLDDITSPIDDENYFDF